MPSHVDDFMAMVDDPTAPSVDPGRPANAALLAILAAVAFSDGTVDDPELEFLARVLPGRDRTALRAWAAASGARHLDFDAVAAAIPGVDDRWKALRFAARMAWKDGKIANEERSLLGELAYALELPNEAVDRVLGDVYGRGPGTVDGQRVLAAIKAMEWDAVEFVEAGLRGTLAAIVPPGSTAIGRVGLEGIELVGFYREGLAARFREGDAFLRWSEIVSFTRTPTLGSALAINAEDGRTHTLGDFRLRGLAVLLDRLFAGGPRPTSPPPRIELAEKRRGREEE